MSNTMRYPESVLPAQIRSAVVIVTLPLLAACGAAQPDQAGPEPSAVHVLAEVFMTERDESANIDSPAVWHGPNGEHWVLSTAKEADVIVVFDAASGEELDRIGGEGTDPGQFDRPNGIAVIDDVVVIVERNNRRIQILSLPEFETLEFVGEDELRWPYGLTVFPGEEAGTYALYVTDNYEDEHGEAPADSLLGERVKHFVVSVENGSVQSELVRSFGPTSGDGVLRAVESIYADPATNRLLIAEETEPSHIKVFTLDGQFTGRSIGAEHFPNEAEGLALYACPGEEGYWLSTDQGDTSNTFHVFDRETLEFIGSFTGEQIMNTDGIALTQQSFGPFPSGAFYAVHDDQAVGAISWDAIAGALDLRTDCTTTRDPG